MTVRRDIRLDIIAKTAEYQREMAKIPGITEKQAARAAVRFEREMSKAQSEAAKAAIKAADQSSKAWEQLGTTVNQALGAAAITSAAKEMFEFATGVFEARNEVINLSKATGISTETFAALQVAAERGGANFEEIMGGVEDFGERLFDFSQGAGGAKEAFELLGFTAEEVQGRYNDVDGVFRDVIDRMSHMEDGALKNAVAQQLFSDAGNRLNAVLGSNELEDYVALAEQYGRVLDANAISQTEKFTLGMSELEGVLTGAATELLDFLEVGDKIRGLAVGFVFFKAVAVESVEAIVGRMQEFANLIGEFRPGNFEGFAAAATDFFSASLGDKIEGINIRAREAAFAFIATTQAVEGSTTSTDRYSTSLDRLSANQEKAEKAAAKLAKEQKEVATANERLNELFLETTEDALNAEQKVQRAFDERVDKIFELVEAGASLDAANAAFAEAQTRRDRDLAKAQKEAADERIKKHKELVDTIAGFERDLLGIEREMRALGLETIRDFVDQGVQTLGKLFDSIGNVVDRQEQAAQRTVSALEASNAAQLASREELLASLEEAETSAEKADIQRKIDALDRTVELNNEVLKAERGQIDRLFKSRQGLEIANAIISGASAAAAAITPPPLGLGPVAGLPLAASSLLFTGTQVALIASQKPPQFDIGFPGPSFTTGPDNYQATLRAGETVNTQAATEAAGGPAAVRAANDTSGAMGGKGTTLVSMSIGRRQLGLAIVDELASGREMSRAVDRRFGRRAGVRPVYMSR